MTAPFQLRRFRPQDFQAVAELAVWASASPETACGQPDVLSVDEFRSDYETRPLEDESWVIESPQGEVVAWVATHMRNGKLTVDGPIVRPDHQRHGLGQMLFTQAEDDARRMGADFLECGVRISNEDGHNFMARLGFAPSRRIFVYETDHPFEPRPTLPEGYTIGELKPRYLIFFLMVMHECFPGYRLPSTPQRLFEPDKMKIFLVLDAEDKPVAAVTAFYYPEDRMGYIYHLGVMEPHRQKGLARGLLHAACEWLWQTHNPRFIGLSTSEENRSVRQNLYERVGFKLQYALQYMRKAVNKRRPRGSMPPPTDAAL